LQNALQALAERLRSGGVSGGSAAGADLGRMSAEIRHAESIVPPSRELEAAAFVALLVLVGLVWLIIGAAVMRGARDPGARTRRLLQRDPADVQAVAAG
jgi:hypothetical protein